MITPLQQKPFSEACERNKAPILEILRELLNKSSRVLEMGSGTGQHAVYFARALPHIKWQTSDLAHMHDGINAWLHEANLPNLLEPIVLDVSDVVWPIETTDAVFSANTMHIISWRLVGAMFAGVAKVLATNGMFILYGPFSYGGQYTSASNAQFDAWLKARDPLSGIRDFEQLDLLAQSCGLRLERDYSMPANNRLLVWCKRG